MGSKVLPQALIAFPRNFAQSPPATLGFSSASIFRRPNSYDWRARARARACARACALVSGASSNPVVEALLKRSSHSSFVVRAEASSGGETEATSDAQVEGSTAVEETPEETAEAETEAEENVETEDFAEPEAEVEEAKPPRKPRVKLGEIMGILNKRAIEASEKERPVPDIRTGDIVEIKLEVPENRRRLSVYKGIVMSKQNAGIHTTIRIRRIIAGIGVEIVFPLYSPNIKEIKVVKHRKVRRARLYYLRDKLPRLSTFK